MRQFTLTPAAGKRLIAKAVVAHPVVQTALKSGTVAIIAGTTNGYVAEEILASIGQAEGLSRSRFFEEIFHARPSDVEEMIQMRLEEKNWRKESWQEEEELWPREFSLGE